jgi:hypothetical protein
MAICCSYRKAQYSESGRYQRRQTLPWKTKTQSEQKAGRYEEK